MTFLISDHIEDICRTIAVLRGRDVNSIPGLIKNFYLILSLSGTTAAVCLINYFFVFQIIRGVWK